MQIFRDENLLLHDINIIYRISIQDRSYFFINCFQPIAEWRIKINEFVFGRICKFLFINSHTPISCGEMLHLSRLRKI